MRIKNFKLFISKFIKKKWKKKKIGKIKIFYYPLKKDFQKLIFHLKLKWKNQIDKIMQMKANFNKQKQILISVSLLTQKFKKAFKRKVQNKVDS